MNASLNRRSFLSLSASFAATALAQPSRPSSGLGIASTSFTTPSAAGAARPTSLALLERCQALGAAGIQANLSGDLPKLRARAEELGMFLEGMVSLPRNGDVAGFERALLDAKASGATVVRSAALSGRRYETFATTQAWIDWRRQALDALKLAVPILEKHRMPLALENHKDFTLEELEPLLASYSSEYLGVCLDFGNNVALLDDPMEFAERMAPYALTTHVKDMGVQPYADGFLLSEVLLGHGILDLPRMLALIRRARPRTRFILEMITRDPLKVPCLTDAYWAPFPERNGRHLARTMRLVTQRASREPLPTVSQLSREARQAVEESNIRACLAHFREKLQPA
ncbi:MAG TPA: TIM barrel protein [Bryobacteraceae bacterium]|nr:TIM barrel protein [Bryobacteraceae bacterium]